MIASFPPRPAIARPVNFMLVLYDRQLVDYPYEASTVEEHYRAFARHSRFTVWQWNTRHGYPDVLDRMDPAVVVLHYSLFGSGLYMLDDRLLEFLSHTRAHKIAFFQDEMAWMQKRFRFVDDYGIDTVYTHIAERDFDATWRRYTSVPNLVHNYPGYVSDDMIEGGRRYGLPEEDRDIDVGYRGRSLPSWLGRAAQEKAIIGTEFARLAADSGLRLDIRTNEEDRIYGEAWHRFVGRCRATLGVESGVSYLDLEDEVLNAYQRIREERGEPPTLEELERGPLGRWDNNFAYRTISPRHFEAAAFRVCQVLFRGEYAGVFEADVHYIPLEKDFSNIDEVIGQLKDPARCRELTERTHRDVIASGRYSYSAFVAGVDRHLVEHGADPSCPPGERRALDAEIRAMADRRRAAARRERLRTLPARAFNARSQASWHVYRTVAPVSRQLRRRLGLRQKEA